MTKSLFLGAVAGFAMVGAVGLSQPAGAYVLTFDGAICNGAGGVCGNGTRINQSYGDVAGLDVQYNHNPGGGLTWGSDAVGDDARMFWWADSYSTLEKVVYGSSGVEVGIFLKPAAGYTVTLNGFDLGMWPNFAHSSQVTIRDGSSNTLLTTGFQVFPGDHPTHFTGPYSSASGIYLLWGPDGYNGGLDNIDYSVTAVGGVPEPATWAMMLIGFAGLGLVMRRRSSAAA